MATRMYFTIFYILLFGVIIADCGELNITAANPHIQCGTVSDQAKLPWHVTVYKKQADKHVLICVGSLISTKHVLSVAHCFWSRVNARAVEASLFSVAVNKVHRLWEEDPQAGRYDIAEIRPHEYYRDEEMFYQFDIAVLTLDREIVFSDLAHPICINWNMTGGDSFLSTGNNGTVPGWGRTENQTASDLLRPVDVPIMNISECRNVAPIGFKSYLTVDKLCAGYHNQNNNTCIGTSGGGLVHSQDTLSPYYILGILSVAPKNWNFPGCNTPQISGYTNVTFHLDWIKNILNRDGPNHVRNTFLVTVPNTASHLEMSRRLG